MVWAATLTALLFLQSGASDPAAAGLKALEEQRWDAAVTSFTQASASSPDNYAVRFNLGFALSMAGREADAIREYKEALRLKPGLYEAELNLGILLLNAKQASDAAVVLEDAAKQKPAEFRPVYYAAEALLAAGQASRAVPLFETAAKLNPKSGEAELGWARALAKDGKIVEADALFRKAGQSSPDALLELASLYESAGKRLEAAALYEKFPNDPAARERAGEILLESGKPAEAIPHLEAAVGMSPTSGNRFALAMAYNAAEQYSKAEPLFAAALQAEPGNLNLRMAYARVLRQQRKYAPAAQEFARAVQAKPDYAEGWSDLAGMLVLLGNDQQALAALDRIRALGAEKPGHYYLRAITLDRNKVFDGALEAYEKFLATSEGKNPDEEFKARQRVRIIRKEASKR